jgi:hypothetical protein
MLAIFCSTMVFVGVSAGQIVVPNPGGEQVITNSTTATIQYVDTPVTQTVNNYSTTITAKVNGSVVFSQTYSAPYSDPSVQQAITQADAVLHGDGATYGTPQLASTSTVLQNTATVTPPPVTCDQAFGGAGVATGATTQSTTVTFGPATINVGQCQDDIFIILSGQEDINVNTDTTFNVAQNLVTTNTYLTTQTYTISGTSSAVPAPALSPLLLVVLGVGLCVIVLRQLRYRT